jgi:hypothetical protein
MQRTIAEIFQEPEIRLGAGYGVLGAGLSIRKAENRVAGIRNLLIL